MAERARTRVRLSRGRKTDPMGGARWEVSVGEREGGELERAGRGRWADWAGPSKEEEKEKKVRKKTGLD